MGRRPPEHPPNLGWTRTPPHPEEWPDRILTIHALSTEPADHASSGYVYFWYNGKLSKLRRLVLTIRQGEEKCNLLIRK